eukprot:CAMPEP_0182417448 /NCGR_PEP_ID=MMETSP1167-20130531/1936_1 /TAXON_ID=2988 /ORGANISM="Mallomonas Sp, Strain CCMP3275" /LENGTH=69 /DNA_ID=CAMNT_0024591039 /DNA_START=48 /DNA_END=257 /DNA_ORIENTATION=+
MSPIAKGSAFWRQAGLNYLQYLSIASNAVRSSLKEPVRSQSLAKQSLQYNRSAPGQDKVPVTSILPGSG